MPYVATVPGVRFGAGIAAGVILAAGLLGLEFHAPGAAARTASAGPREIYQALNALRVESGQVYYVKDLHLRRDAVRITLVRSEEHTSELQSQSNLVCRLLLVKKNHSQH